jgi:3-hydroxyacyl-CoA dehydrogenase
MKIIAVIGAGTMGNGIAHTFAQSGFTVKLIDLSEKITKEWLQLLQIWIEWCLKEQ